VLGTPAEHEVDGLGKEDTRNYVRCFKQRRSVPLTSIDRFKAASPESMDLLKQMLVFDPSKRITIDKCLDHPAFESVRKPHEEKKATQRMVLDFESEGELDELKLRKYFLLEIQRYHPELELPYQIKMLK